MKKQTKNNARWVAVFLAILILAVAVMAAITQGFTNWNPWGWFGKDQIETPSDKTDDQNKKDDVAAVGGMELPEEVTGSGIKLRAARLSATEEGGIAAQSENSFTLTATIEPSNAENKAVDWAVAWNDSSSSWASGKSVSNYVTVTPSADGALTATVACLQAFGEKVKVTVTSRDNANASATCIADYRKRMTDTTISLTANGATQSTVMLGSGDTYTISAQPVYSAGTVNPTFSASGYTLKVSDEFKTEFGKVCYAYSHSYTWVVPDQTYSIDSGSFVADSEFSLKFFAVGQSMETTAKNWFKEAISKMSSNHLILSFTASCNYNGESQSINKEIPITLNGSLLRVGVTGVTVGNDSLIF